MNRDSESNHIRSVYVWHRRSASCTQGRICVAPLVGLVYTRTYSICVAPLVSLLYARMYMCSTVGRSPIRKNVYMWHRWSASCRQFYRPNTLPTSLFGILHRLPSARKTSLHSPVPPTDALVPKFPSIVSPSPCVCIFLVCFYVCHVVCVCVCLHSSVSVSPLVLIWCLYLFMS